MPHSGQLAADMMVQDALSAAIRDAGAEILAAAGPSTREAASRIRESSTPIRDLFAAWPAAGIVEIRNDFAKSGKPRRHPLSGADRQ